MNTIIKNGFNVCKNILVALMLLCATNTLPKQMKSLAQERQEEAKREGIQKIDLGTVVRNNTPDLYTQTQAHVQIKKLRELIQEQFGDKSSFKKDKVVPFFDIISRMVTQEAELKDTHYVFYHAAPTMLAIMTDLFTQLYFEIEHPEEKEDSDDTFRFLRFQGQGTGLSARQFVEKELRAQGIINDKDRTIMAILLSANLSLFGNVGYRTECTWNRFTENWRKVEDWQEEELKKMMSRFGLSEKHVKEIIALDDVFDSTPESMLLQIFIPKNIVDGLVYPAWTRGTPALDPIFQWIKEHQSSEAVSKENKKSTRESQVILGEIFKKEQEKNPIFKQLMEELKSGSFSMYALLRAYCSVPREVPHLNDTQGRILFTKEGLLNPSSGIKFYSYFSTPREKLEEYTVKLNKLVKKLIAEKEGKKVEAPQLKPTVKPTPSPIKPQPSPVVTPKRTPTPVKTPKQTPIARPTRQIPMSRQQKLKQVQNPYQPR